MLNEGTSIQASICVSVRLVEGELERPIQSFYGLQTLFGVTDMIFQSLPACQNTYHTCKNEDMKCVSFSRAVKWMVGKSMHLQSDVFCKEEKKGQAALEALPVCVLRVGGICSQCSSLYYQLC